MPHGTQYQALLADGSLVDTTLTIAGLALTSEDIVEVRWSAEAEGVQMSVRLPVPTDAAKGNGKAAYANPRYSFKLCHPEMNPWPVKLPASASLSDALGRGILGSQGLPTDRQ
ncbi:hypothetical protein WJX77_005248 [Trebouxia sp. C0004]